MKHRFRRVAPVVAAAVLGTALVACEPVPATSGGDAAASECASAGPATQAVHVRGDGPDLPEAEFTAPLLPEETERAVLVDGDGPVVEVGDIVTVDFVAYNAATGELVETTGYGAAGIGRTLITIEPGATTIGMRQALLCSSEGSRILAVVHPDDGVGTPSADGVEADDPLIYVIDVVSVAQRRASGAPVEAAVAGMPEVTDAGVGSPTIAVPPGAAPVELQVATVLEGDGPQVRSGSDVVVRFRSVLWRNGFTVEENWSKPRADRIAVSDMLPGVQQAITGAPVGSRVLAVVPPALGYGPEGDFETSVTGSDTLVYVIDILATT